MLPKIIIRKATILFFVAWIGECFASNIPHSMQPFEHIQTFEEFEAVLASFPKIYEIELTKSHGQNGDLVSKKNPLVIAGMKVADGWVNVRYFKDNNKNRSFEMSATDENGILRPFYFADPLPKPKGKKSAGAGRGRRQRTKLFTSNRLGNCYAGCHSPSVGEADARNVDTPYGMILPVILSSKDDWVHAPGMAATENSPASLPQTASFMQLRNIQTFVKHLQMDTSFQEKKRLFRLAILNCESWQEESERFAEQRLHDFKKSIFLSHTKTQFLKEAELYQPLTFGVAQNDFSPEQVRWVSVQKVWSRFSRLLAFVTNSSRAYSMDFELPSAFEQTQKLNHEIYTKMMLTAGDPDLYLILSHVGGASSKKPMLIPEFHFNFQHQLVESFAKALDIPKKWQDISQSDLCQ